ncbi:VirD4-like conjugal transfer protein, CD1115 family [Sporolactobacillus sp. KGMB 08714]|uniref:VirD4-like conjugal transfer protein, CD1115 family n=1 Tax=Sporolactobacillus sp. KGMB 08714 TaxID=3064704 RepID=UPI002FBE5C6B
MKWKDDKADYWRNNRWQAYRNLPSYLIQKKLLLPVIIGIWLIILLLCQVIDSSVTASYQSVRSWNGHVFEIPFSASFSQSFSHMTLFTQYPLFSAILAAFTAVWAAIFYLILRRSYYAMEDRFTAGTNRFSTRQELVEQYPFMPSDIDASFDDVPGLPIAHFSYREVRKWRRKSHLKIPTVRIENHLPELVDTEQLESKRQQTEKAPSFLGKTRLFFKPPTKKFLISIAQEVTNVCIIGITRSGKKVFSVAPILDAFSRPRSVEKKASFIISDPKGELIQENYLLLKKRGYKIRILNLMHTYESNAFNPFAAPIEDYAKYLDESLDPILRNEALDRAIKAIMNIAYTFYENPEAKEPMWADNAQLFFTAVAILLIEQCIRRHQTDRAGLYSLAMVMESLSSDVIASENHPYLIKYAKNDTKKRQALFKKYKTKTCLDVLFGELPISHPARAQFGGIKMAAKASATLGGIAAHVFAGLKTYIQPGVATLMARNDFNFEKMGFGDQPVATFLIIPDQDKTNHKLATFFIEQSYKKLVDRAFDAPHQECKRPVIYLLDEFGNLPPVSDMDTKLSACLGRNIRFFIVLQSFSQLNKYPQGTEDTILSNCGYTFLIKTPSKETTELISTRLGKRPVLDVNRTGKWFSVNKDETEMVKDVELMTVSELESMQFGENVILRIMKNEDLEGHPITAYPILNQGRTRMRGYYDYLPTETASWQEITEAHESEHRRLQLQDLLVTLDPPEINSAEKVEKTVEQEPITADPENITSPEAKSQATLRERRRMKILLDVMGADVTTLSPCCDRWNTTDKARLIELLQKNTVEKGFAGQVADVLSRPEATLDELFRLLVSVDKDVIFNKITELIKGFEEAKVHA